MQMTSKMTRRSDSKLKMAVCSRRGRGSASHERGSWTGPWTHHPALARSAASPCLTVTGRERANISSSRQSSLLMKLSAFAMSSSQSVSQPASRSYASGSTSAASLRATEAAMEASLLPLAIARELAQTLVACLFQTRPLKESSENTGLTFAPAQSVWPR